MKFFCIKNIVDSTVFQQVPWEYKPNIPDTIKTKDDRKKWWRTPSTNHCFYSMFEGQHPELRISEKNPAAKMYGFVVDYDEDITDDMYNAPNFEKAIVLPYAWSKTSSGRGRMVWVFEKPLPLPDTQTVTQFLKVITVELGLKKIWPGFDEAFYRATQYYEVGNSWNVPANSLVPHSIVVAMMCKAWEGRNKHITLNAPLEELYAEIERKFPGQWKGPFQLGQRTKRFWDTEAKNPTSAVLRANGFQCFSGNKAFVSWGELLGEAFVRSLESEKMKEASDGIFYDGKMYYVKSSDDTWMTYTQENIRLYLRVRLGLASKPASQADVSDLDRTLCYIQDAGRIEAAMPFVMRKPGTIYYQNKRYLNTSMVKAIEPVPADTKVSQTDFPWLGHYLQTFFDNEYQLAPFLAWLKRFYEGCLYYKPCGGQAIFIVGAKNKGKTLLSNYIISTMVGGFIEGASFLLGEDGGFSASFLEKPLLTIDDTTVSADDTKHTKYSAILKRLVANKEFFYNQKFQKAGNIPWTGRVIVTCNTDPESMRVLPNIDISIKDKIMLFKTSDVKRNFKDGFIESINRELPYFCRWLLDWKVPEDTLLDDGRFGVKPYHHPALYRCALHSGSSHSFLELLQMFMYEYRTDYKQTWEGTATKLASELQNCQATSGLSIRLNGSKVGLFLGQLKSRGYRLSNKHTQFGTKWEIPCDLEQTPVSEDDLDEDSIYSEDDVTFDPEAISRTSSIFQHDGSGLIPALKQGQ